jgi:opacity protein-like surface antigen
MKRSLRRICTIGCVLLALPAMAAAQSVAEPGTWTVTPFLGTSIGIDPDIAGNSIGVGAAIGYDLTSNLGFEGEFSHLFDVAGDTAGVDWSVTNVSANGIYHFNVQNVTPYATFGLGIEHSGVDVQNTRPNVPLSSTEMAFNFGGGVKYQASRTIIVRGDLRRFEANDTAPDFWRLYGGVTFIMGR